MASLRPQSTAKNKQVNASLREHAKNRKIMRIFAFFLCLLFAFVVGFAVRSSSFVMAALGMSSDGGASSQSSQAQQKTTYDSISARVSEAEDLIKANSMDEINLNDATISMLTDLLESTGDPYATYFNQDRYESYIKETAGKGYSGVGVLFGDYDGRAYAIDVLEGSEAQARGVSKGDFVEAIDGDSSHGWSASEVIGALAREDGENVVITWMRPISVDATRGTEFTTTLECKKYDAENVTAELDEDVGYIKLRQITSNSCDLVKNAITSLVSEGAEALVLDIRDNPGGYLTQSLDIANLFVPSGVLVGIETNEGTNTRTANGTTITNLPLVVLMNGYTSAAAEVLVAALQDNQVATTVGQKTMGKGSVQVIRELTFGGAIRYTAAYYLTPLGHQINGVGISPDISVSGTDEGDTQKLVAIDSARSLIQQD